jgi:drug/metabolite transporter (DMT)-like permease
MSTEALVLVLVIGLVCWGGWTIIAQASDVQDPYVRAFLVSVVCTIMLLPFLPGRFSMEIALSKGGKLLLLAGVVNALGHILFPRLQTMKGSQVSIYMTSIIGLNFIAKVGGGAVFLGEPLTFAKMAGVALIMMGVGVLSRWG